MNNIKIQNEDGLPEVAQKFSDRKPIVLAMLGIVFIAGLGWNHFAKMVKKESPPVQESYAVEHRLQDDLLNTQPVTQKSSIPAAVKSDPVLEQEQIALLEAKRNELQQRLSAPLMLVNNAQSTNKDPSIQPDLQSPDSSVQAMKQFSTKAADMVSPAVLESQDSTIAQGSLIHAILESATNSDLPGFVRAIVSEPSYSEDGAQILIPRGSRLIGQYKSAISSGQSRIFMIWDRLITPAGVSIQLGSPGVDNLGMAGVSADEINTHFWGRFGSGSLLSIIGAGAANVGVSASDQENSESFYRKAISNSFAQSANQSLEKDYRIPSTLVSYQGKPIIVFVARDLFFKDVIKQTKLKFNIF